VPLVKAVQEQQLLIKQQSTTIEQLQALVTSMEQRLQKLEQKQ
jgi:hypothetical protein